MINKSDGETQVLTSTPNCFESYYDPEKISKGHTIFWKFPFNHLSDFGTLKGYLLSFGYSFLEWSLKASPVGQLKWKIKAFFQSLFSPR